MFIFLYFSIPLVVDFLYNSQKSLFPWCSLKAGSPVEVNAREWNGIEGNGREQKGMKGYGREWKGMQENARECEGTERYGIEW